MFKTKIVFALAVMMALSSIGLRVANAQAPDPAIRTGGGHGSVPITSRDFVIVSPTGDSPATSDCVVIQHGVSTTAPGCFFLNNITNEEGGGVTIKGIVFIASKSSITGALSCALDTALGGQSPWFSKCTVAPNGVPVVVFSGGSGIPYGGDFSFGFRQFNSNANFGVAAVARF